MAGVAPFTERTPQCNHLVNPIRVASRNFASVDAAQRVAHESDFAIARCDQGFHGLAQTVFVKTLHPEVTPLPPTGGGVAQVLQKSNQGLIAQIICEKTGNDHHAFALPGAWQSVQKRRYQGQNGHIGKCARRITQGQQQAGWLHVQAALLALVPVIFFALARAAVFGMVAANNSSKLSCRHCR